MEGKRDERKRRRTSTERGRGGADEDGQRRDCDPVVEEDELGVPRALPAERDQKECRRAQANAGGAPGGT